MSSIQPLSPRSQKGKRRSLIDAFPDLRIGSSCFKLIWPVESGKSRLDFKSTRLEGLEALFVLRPLKFPDDVTLPNPFRHSSLSPLAMLFRRGADRSITPCHHCARENRRFGKCVSIAPRPSSIWPKDFFDGVCANCLPTSATSCTLSKFTSPLSL